MAPSTRSKQKGSTFEKRKLTSLTNKLNCASGRSRDCQEIYTPVMAANAHTNQIPEPKNNSTQQQNIGDEIYSKDKSASPFDDACSGELATNEPTVVPRSHIVKELVAAPCIDDYDPPHQLGPDYIIPTENKQVWKRDDPVQFRYGFSKASEYQPISLITLIERKVKEHPLKTAISVKRNGEWIRWTYQRLWDESRTVGKAFIKLGLKRFHGVGVLAFNSPEWYFSTLGTLFAGGLLAGIYCTNSASACQYILHHNEANIVVVDNEQQLHKVLEIRNHLPHLKAIVQFLGEPTAPGVLSWSDLLEVGNSVPDLFLDRRIKSIAINQCCTLIYTSGTTGAAKAVMLNHDNLAMTLHLVNENWHLSEDTGLRGVSFLPLSHVAAQLSDLFVPLCIGGEVMFAQPDAMKGTLVHTLRESKPRHFIAVPRIYEKIYEKVMEGQSQMGFLKRNMMSWSLRRGFAYTTNLMNGNRSAPYGFAIANKVLQQVKETLGFKETVSWFGGAAPISKDVHKFFLSLNIIILEGYGLSESTGPHILNTRDAVRVGSVGKTSIFQTRIDKPDNKGDGEVCIKGRNVFMGYLGMEDQTMEAIDDDGWLHSGDVGRFDEDDYLHITGRIKELLITAGGENIAPVPIEDRIKDELPVVSQAVLIGDTRKFLSVLLTLKTDVDLNTMMPLDKLTHQAREWCKLRGSNARTLTDILTGPDKQVFEAIQQGIDRVNQNAVSNAQRIQKWIVLPRNFSIPTQELGPTMKLKRLYITEKYHDEIESFYNAPA